MDTQIGVWSSICAVSGQQILVQNDSIVALYHIIIFWPTSTKPQILLLFYFIIILYSVNSIASSAIWITSYLISAVRVQ